MSDKGKLKILWAINPFDEERSVLARTGGVARQAVGDRSIELEPVYVMSPRSLGISPEVAGSVARYRLKTREGLNRALEQCRLPGLKPVPVLLDGSGTLNDNVSALLKYAERTGAGLIVASTHSRRGLSRPILGSFAETLLQRSRAQALGLNAELIIDPGVNGLVPSILEQARKRKAQAIVMASRKKALRDAAGGSTARQVVREAACPVWVI